jgi:LacI family transcriptional regulator
MMTLGLMGTIARRVTISDVARRARVSKTTVSHVVSGKRPVAQKTRERVERAIAHLGYRPNTVARSLRTKRSHMVALVIPDITNPFYPILARGLEDGMDGSGYRAFICNTDGRPERELEFLEEVSDRRVDGIIIDSFSVTVDQLESVTAGRIPVVWMGGTAAMHRGVDVVRPDDAGGAAAAASHLLERGHRLVAMIDGPAGTGPARRTGFRQALRAADERVREHIVRGDWTRTGGAKAIRRLLDASPSPTAVFCANDLMAMGVLDAADELGLRVPEDLAVVGFDDIEPAAMTQPPLSTVVNPAFETGRTAGTLLLSRISGAYRGPARTVTLPSALVVRGSS